MIDNLIMMQPKKVREASILEDVRISIPTKLSEKSLRETLKEPLNEKGHNPEKALTYALRAKPKKNKNMFTLIRDLGR